MCTNTEGGDHVGVSLEDGHRGRGLETPHADELVTGSDGKQLIVVADCHVIDLGVMASEGEEKTTRQGAPHFHQVVV